MPSLVFPAPGSPYATRLTTTFSGFDVAAVTTTTIKNLLLDSQTFLGQNWTVGPYSIPFNAVTDYVTDSILQSNISLTTIGSQTLVTASSNIQRIGQQLSVLPNTTYTFSFYARRGTATDNKYKVLDFSRNTDLVAPTSYYSQINGSTLTRVTVTFTTSLNTRIVVLYPVWDIASGYGTSYITNAQFELGTSATTYQATYSNVNSAANITVNRGVGTVKLQNIRQPISNIAVGKLKAGFKVKSLPALETNAKLNANAKLVADRTRLDRVSQMVKAKFTTLAVVSTNYGFSNRLNTFDNVGLVEGTVYTVTSVNSGVKSNTVLEYIYDLNLISSSTSLVNELIVSFDNAEMRYVFGIGSYVTLTSNTGVLYTTLVLARTPNTVTVAKPTNWDTTWGFSTIASASVSVYPQAKVTPTRTPTNPREQLLYSQMVSNRGVSTINTVYATPIWNAYFFNYTGTTQSLASGTLQLPIAKLTSTGTIQQGNVKSPTFKLTSVPPPRLGTARSIAKLAPDSSYSIVTTTSSSSKIQFYPAVNVVGSNLSTANTVLWYINENDILMSVPTGTSLITLYFDPLMPGTYSTARISQGVYINTFSIVSHTLNSITFLNPSDLPSVSGMLLELGTTLNYTDYSYAYRNTAPTIRKFSIDFNGVRLFETPKSSNLTAGIKVKGDTNRLAIGRTDAVTKLKTTATLFLQGAVEKNSFILKSERTAPIITGRVDVFEKYKVSYNATQVFYTPISNKLSSAQVLKDVKISLPTEMLSKQLFILKDTKSVVSQSNLALQVFKLTDGVKLVTSLVEKLKVTANNTQVFYTPASDKLTSAQVLKAVTSQLSVDKANTIAKLKTDNTLLSISEFDKLKVAARNTQVFYVPQANKLSSAQVLKDIRVVLPTGTIDKQTAILKDTRSVLAQANLSFELFKLAGEVRIQTSLLQTLKVKNTQMFETPLTNKLVSTSVLKSTQFDARINKLISTATLRPIVPDITYSYIEKLKVTARNTVVFETPLSNKLTASTVVRADRSTVKLASFKVNAMPVRDVAYNLKTNYLSKPVTSLKQGGTVFNYYNIDNTFYQSNVVTNLAPTNAREMLFYANMAPGYRTNNSIQQGHVFSPAGSELSANQLEVFDNVKFASAPFYNVTSQVNGTTANSVLEYIYDLDIITVSTSPINTLQLSFDNAERAFTAPYPVGSYVALTILNHPMYFAQVIDSSFNTVTIAKPDDWSVDWIAIQIGSASPTVFPKVNVRPDGRPKNAREMLFYSEMAFGFVQNKTIQDGELFATFADNGIKRTSFLERDAWRIREVKNSNVVSFGGLAKLQLVVKGLADTSNTLGKATRRIDLFGVRQEAFLSNVDNIERVRWGINPNYGTRFAEVIRLESQGGIIRFKTGIFNKMHDVAVKKKEPLQFWN